MMNATATAILHRIGPKTRTRLHKAGDVLCWIVLGVLAIDLLAFNTADSSCGARQTYVRNWSPPSGYSYGSVSGSNDNPNKPITDHIDYASDLCEKQYYSCRNLPIYCNDSARGWAAINKRDLGKFSFMRPWWPLTLIGEEFFQYIGACIINIFLFIGFLFKAPALFSALPWLAITIAYGFAIYTLDEMKSAATTSGAIGGDVKAPPLSRIGQESALGDAQIATASQVATALRTKNPNYADEIEFDE